MTDIEIPDNEDAACDLDNVQVYFANRGQYMYAERVIGAARRLRADAEEIARLRQCETCHSDKVLAEIVTRMIGRPDIAFLRVREVERENARLTAEIGRLNDELVARGILDAERLAECEELRADVVWVARRTDRWGGLSTVDDSEVLEQARSARRRAVREARKQ